MAMPEPKGGIRLVDNTASSSWRDGWTVPGPLTREDVRRAVEILRANRLRPDTYVVYVHPTMEATAKAFFGCGVETVVSTGASCG